MLVILGLIVLAVSLTGPVPESMPPIDEVDRVKARMAPLQLLSFATNLEYCGYLARTADGSLVFTEMVRGGHYGCTPAMPPGEVTLIASMHTHGAYRAHIPSEFPTSLDINSDAREGVNGYISTPGGRLWYVDGRARTAILLCGPGCLPQDPAFHPGDDGPIAPRYSLWALRRMEAAE